MSKKTPRVRLTPGEQRIELDRLRAIAQDRISRMPYVYQDWGVVRTRAYRLQLEQLQKCLQSTDKRLNRVIARIRRTLGRLDVAATSPNIEALAASLDRSKAARKLHAAAQEMRGEA